MTSFALMGMIIIGGLGTVLGSFLGAGFFVMLPIGINHGLGAFMDVVPQRYPVQHRGHRLRRADRVFPDCGALWHGPALAHHQGQDAPVAVSVLTGCVFRRQPGVVNPRPVHRRGIERTRALIREHLLESGSFSTPTIMKKEVQTWDVDSSLSLIAAVLIVGFLFSAGQVLAQEKKEPLKQFMGVLAYRTGPFAAGGSGFSGGMEDYMELMNMEGGINGVMYEWEECETAYNIARGIECYNRFKDKTDPSSTPSAPASPMP